MSILFYYNHAWAETVIFASYMDSLEGHLYTGGVLLAGMRTSAFKQSLFL